MEIAATGSTSARPRALDEATFCGAFQATAAERPDEVALRTREGETTITWAAYAERVRALAAGFAALGVGRGETFGLMLTNRPEFHLADTAAMHLGATCFSVYNTSSPEQIEFLLGDAQNRVIVTEQAFLDRLEQVRGKLPTVEHLVVVDGAAEGALSLEDVEAAGTADFDFDAAWRAVEPADILTLIYTSGTTGAPKGVQLTHANMVAELRALNEVFPREAGGRTVSFLPMAHVADRTFNHYAHMAYGFAVTCCPDPRELFAYLPEVRPTPVFGGVPRIWEKLKAGLETMIANEADAERKSAMEWAFETGLARVRVEQAGEEVPEGLLAECEKADALVFAGIRQQLGIDRAEWFAVGAAPTPVVVLEFFAAMGVRICELWGMSETTTVNTINPRDAIRFGTVGPPVPGIEVKLAGDGEVLVRGPLVMAGYRNQPEKTAETIDPEGWLHSGDIGEFDEAGYLKIVDRKKELIINAAGKNMSPANIEAAIKSSSPLIGQACVIGDRRPYNTALIVLDTDFAPAWAPQQGIEDTSFAALAADERVIAAVQEAVEAGNAKLSRVEQVKKFRILPCDWEPAGDELTPTMKLKRRPIAEKYADEIDALYA